MGKIIITIARQYGSGGKTIGQKLAKDLGINCYDRELMRLASDDSGIAEGLFGKADERLKNSPLIRITKNVYKGQLIPPESDEFTSNDNLFNYQAKVIKELAEAENCVIIGRCADYVLSEFEHVVSVFIHGNREYCIARAKERLGYTSDKEVEKFINKTDKYRAEYYKYYTGREWNDARNYDLCLDSSELDMDGCVKAVKAYIDIRYPGLLDCI
jgi:cytidylate kinase